MEDLYYLHTLLGFELFCDYKPTNSNHLAIPGVYTSYKISSLSTTMKNHLKCDIIHGSVVNGLRQPILYSFVIAKLPGYKVFCELETVFF